MLKTENNVCIFHISITGFHCWSIKKQLIFLYGLVCHLVLQFSKFISLECFFFLSPWHYPCRQSYYLWIMIDLFLPLQCVCLLLLCMLYCTTEVFYFKEKSYNFIQGPDVKLPRMRWKNLKNLLTHDKRSFKDILIVLGRICVAGEGIKRNPWIFLTEARIEW